MIIMHFGRWTGFKQVFGMFVGGNLEDLYGLSGSLFASCYIPIGLAVSSLVIVGLGVDMPCGKM